MKKHKPINWNPHDLPDMLRVDPDGRLFCTDGRSVRSYLREWAKQVKITEAAPVSLRLRVCAQQERDEAMMFRHWGA